MKKTSQKKPQLKARYGHRKSRPLKTDERAFVQSLGLAIKSMRVAAGITGDELGQRLGVTTPTQFHRESGGVSMPIEELYRYAVALGCKPSDILREAEQSLPIGKMPAKRRGKPAGKRASDASNEETGATEDK